jgi:hypothetical protein
MSTEEVLRAAARAAAKAAAANLTTYFADDNHAPAHGAAVGKPPLVLKRECSCRCGALRLLVTAAPCAAPVIALLTARLACVVHSSGEGGGGPDRRRGAERRRRGRCGRAGGQQGRPGAGRRCWQPAGLAAWLQARGSVAAALLCTACRFSPAESAHVCRTVRKRVADPGRGALLAVVHERKRECGLGFEAGAAELVHSACAWWGPCPVPGHGLCLRAAPHWCPTLPWRGAATTSRRAASPATLRTASLRSPARRRAAPPAMPAARAWTPRRAPPHAMRVTGQRGRTVRTRSAQFHRAFDPGGGPGHAGLRA